MGQLGFIRQKSDVHFPQDIVVVMMMIIITTIEMGRTYNVNITFLMQPKNENKKKVNL
jgi:hypothetical protein